MIRDLKSPARAVYPRSGTDVSHAGKGRTTAGGWRAVQELTVPNAPLCIRIAAWGLIFRLSPRAGEIPGLPAVTSDECKVRIEAFGPFLVGGERPPGPHEVVDVDFTDVVDARVVQGSSSPVIELDYEFNHDGDITAVDPRHGAALALSEDAADRKGCNGNGR